MNFNFEYWSRLFQRDPAAFNRERIHFLHRTAINLSHGDTEKVQRLMALVNGWDMKLDRVKNPVARQAKLESLFTEQLLKFSNALEDIRK